MHYFFNKLLNLPLINLPHKLLTKLLCVVCTMLLSSCTNYHSEQEITSIEPLNVIALLPVPKTLQNRVWLEKFTFSLTGENTQLTNKFVKQSMLLQTELSKQGINLAAMSFSGALLAQATWLSGEQTIASEIGLAKDFNAKQVLHDLQISHWPIAQLQNHLPTGFSVSEKLDSENVKVRHFYRGDEIVIVIYYFMSDDQKTMQKINFQHHMLGYQLSIERLSDSLLSRAE